MYGLQTFDSNSKVTLDTSKTTSGILLFKFMPAYGYEEVYLDILNYVNSYYYSFFAVDNPPDNQETILAKCTITNNIVRLYGGNIGFNFTLVGR